LEIVKRNHQWKNPTIICLRNDRNIKKWERNIKIQITFVEINTNILTNAQKCISLFIRINNFKRFKSLYIRSCSDNKKQVKKETGCTKYIL
jgi:hypothetical protein